MVEAGNEMEVKAEEGNGRRVDEAGTGWQFPKGVAR